MSFQFCQSWQNINNVTRNSPTAAAVCRLKQKNITIFVVGTPQK
jgi:hypothetical protein